MNNAHCYLLPDRGKYVFILYEQFVPPYGAPVASGKRDTLESAIDAARSAAKKHSLTVGSWSNLESTI